MYDPHHVLKLVDGHLLGVLMFGGLSFGSLFVYFYETARLGFRDRCAPLTLVAVGVFIAHDGNFVLNFHDWFTTYDHWLLKGFWLALVLTTCIELVFLAAIIRFGREEMAPHLSQPAWTAVCLGAVAACIVGWGLLKSTIDDPLYLVSFMLTITWCLPSVTALYLRRGTRRGLSVLLMRSYWLMALGYVLLTIVVFGFHAFWWIAVCVLTLVWGAVMLVAVSRAPAYEPAGLARETRAVSGSPRAVAADGT